MTTDANGDTAVKNPYGAVKKQAGACRADGFLGAVKLILELEHDHAWR